jgi:hypothetical protein
MRTICLAALLALAIGLSLSGQSVPVPANDPDVFAAFLRMHHAIVSGTETTGSSSGKVDGVKAGVPAAPSFSKGWQQDIGISDADFSKIEPAYLALKDQLDNLRSEAAASATAHTSSADSAILRNFRGREVALINSTKADLRSRLSPAGSAALFSFIDGRFRAAVTRIAIGNSR